MTERLFGEGVFQKDSSLLEQAKAMELIDDSAILDSPLAGFVETLRTGESEGREHTIESVSAWIREINPEYDPFDVESPYNVNCGACAFAVFQRLNGNTEIQACAENIGTDELMENVLGKKFVTLSPQEIEEYLLEQGEGAHSVIGVDRSMGSGHWFNAACLEGRVVAIDGQSGEILEWPPDYGDVVRWEIAV